jgi:hypothetical protein
MYDRPAGWLVGAQGNLLQRWERGEEWGLSKPHGSGGWQCHATPYRGLLLLGVGPMYPCMASLFSSDTTILRSTLATKL